MKWDDDSEYIRIWKEAVIILKVLSWHLCGGKP
jgi:hypothetical protein